MYYMHYILINPFFLRGNNIGIYFTSGNWWEGRNDAFARSSSRRRFDGGYAAKVRRNPQASGNVRTKTEEGPSASNKGSFASFLQK